MGGGGNCRVWGKERNLEAEQRLGNCSRLTPERERTCNIWDREGEISGADRSLRQGRRWIGHGDSGTRRKTRAEGTGLRNRTQSTRIESVSG